MSEAVVFAGTTVLDVALQLLADTTAIALSRGAFTAALLAQLSATTDLSAGAAVLLRALEIDADAVAVALSRRALTLSALADLATAAAHTAGAAVLLAVQAGFATRLGVAIPPCSVTDVATLADLTAALGSCMSMAATVVAASAAVFGVLSEGFADASAIGLPRGTDTAPLLTALSSTADGATSATVLWVDQHLLANTVTIALALGADTAPVATRLAALALDATGTTVLVGLQTGLAARSAATIAPGGLADVDASPCSASGVWTSVRMTQAIVAAAATVADITLGFDTNTITLDLARGAQAATLAALLAAATAVVAGTAVAFAVEGRFTARAGVTVGPASFADVGADPLRTARLGADVSVAAAVLSTSPTVLRVAL
jgi:hypothetical protein